MKYLINIKILSLVISFICTLSVSSWERGSEAMTWPLNNKKKKTQQNMQGRKEEKRHCNVPCSIQTELLSLEAGFPVNERTSFLSSSPFCFPTLWPPLNHSRVMTFGHQRGRGDAHLIPSAVHPQPGTGCGAQPALRARAPLAESRPRDLPQSAVARRRPGGTLGVGHPGKMPSGCEN